MSSVTDRLIQGSMWLSLSRAIVNGLSALSTFVLAWYLVPEFRESAVPGPPEVAVDVVDRLDRTQIVRAISLGFLIVSRDTHQLEPELVLTRKDFASLVRKMARLTARNRSLPPCLASDVLPSSSLEECGILSETSSRGIGGRSAMRAIERAARAGREGAVP